MLKMEFPGCPGTVERGVGRISVDVFLFISDVRLGTVNITNDLSQTCLIRNSPGFREVPKRHQFYHPWNDRTVDGFHQTIGPFQYPPILKGMPLFTVFLSVGA